MGVPNLPEQVHLLACAVLGCGEPRREARAAAWTGRSRHAVGNVGRGLPRGNSQPRVQRRARILYAGARWEIPRRIELVVTDARLDRSTRSALHLDRRSL